MAVLRQEAKIDLNEFTRDRLANALGRTWGTLTGLIDPIATLDAYDSPDLGDLRRKHGILAMSCEYAETIARAVLFVESLNPLAG